jgi:hypothetical protein
MSARKPRAFGKTLDPLGSRGTAAGPVGEGRRRKPVGARGVGRSQAREAVLVGWPPGVLVRSIGAVGREAPSRGVGLAGCWRRRVRRGRGEKAGPRRAVAPQWVFLNELRSSSKRRSKSRSATVETGQLGSDVRRQAAARVAAAARNVHVPSGPAHLRTIVAHEGRRPYATGRGHAAPQLVDVPQVEASPGAGLKAPPRARVTTSGTRRTRATPELRARWQPATVAAGRDVDAAAIARRSSGRSRRVARSGP